eukprot:1161441-Pelagomonas_calceolata.AAC.7
MVPLFLGHTRPVPTCVITVKAAQCTHSSGIHLTLSRACLRTYRQSPPLHALERPPPLLQLPWLLPALPAQPRGAAVGRTAHQPAKAHARCYVMTHVTVMYAQLPSSQPRGAAVGRKAHQPADAHA